jgi:predicted dehydrogenase
MKMNRRLFVGRSLAAAAGAWAGPLILSGRAIGENAPSKRVTIGMIGVGRWGSDVNLKPFLAMPDVQVVAVSDVDAWRLDTARTRVEQHYAKVAAGGTYKGCKAFKDFRELLAQPDIDAVMVSTPDHWHIPAAVAAVRAGKDVAVEKPISLSIEEGRLFANEAKRFNRVTRNDSEFRSLPDMRKACELVLNGRIGKLQRILTTVPKTDVTCPPQPEMPVPAELDYEAWLGPAPKAPYTVKRVHDPKKFDRPGWMRVSDYCEGIITNWGTHLNDIAQCANGSDETGPVEVQALRWELPPRENTWNVLTDFEIAYKYANGVELNYKMAEEVIVRMEGTEGWIQVRYGKDIQASTPSVLSSPLPAGARKLPAWGDKQDFIRCVKSRERTMQDAEIGHRTCSLCQLGHISIKTGGKKLQWDPVKERITNLESANQFLKRAHWSFTI